MVALKPITIKLYLPPAIEYSIKNKTISNTFKYILASDYVFVFIAKDRIKQIHKIFKANKRKFTLIYQDKDKQEYVVPIAIFKKLFENTDIYPKYASHIDLSNYFDINAYVGVSFKCKT